MNENLKMFLQKVAADEKIQAKMQSFTNIDEAYDYAVSIQDGYSKEEFEAVMVEITKGSAENDEISDDDLENVAGGIISEARRLRAVDGNSDNLTNFAAGAI
jgi:predicted ribosomally synthesized peptide with nif11-like leader